ncbi:hypothetical protein ACIQPR_43645 [Streptomyces sp. NPDC091280]|uniref:hypothetical protein n=1 Tax=Streptomyces sp. NPDC091280 TaxID=3365984 RepID=UPI003829A9E4
MANEISYPFTADSAGGGSQMVSQQQWQYMARQFGKDRVDYRLNTASLAASDLPFYAQVVNGTTVSIAPGRALVGGFFYQLTSTQTVTIAANTGTTGRCDLIVLRADMSAGSVNLKVVQGQPAASPKWPSPTKAYGGVWEMTLHVVNVPANSGALTLINVMPFDFPETQAAPWNVSQAAQFQQVGTFLVDMDNNNTDTQTEYFVGRDGTVVTRDLGKPRTYTPTLVNNTGDVPDANKVGRWRWISPGVLYFSVSLTNDYEDTGPVRTGTAGMGITLPRTAAASTGQVFKGRLSNPYYNGGLPNSVDITAVVNQSSSAQSVMYLWAPNPTNLAEGLDLLRAIPPRSQLTISGVLEASAFGN